MGWRFPIHRDFWPWHIIWIISSLYNLETHEPGHSLDTPFEGWSHPRILCSRWRSFQISMMEHLSCSHQRTIAWWQPGNVWLLSGVVFFLLDVSIMFHNNLTLNNKQVQARTIEYNLGLTTRLVASSTRGTTKPSLFFSVIAPKDLQIVKRSVAVNYTCTGQQWRFAGHSGFCWRNSKPHQSPADMLSQDSSLPEIRIWDCWWLKSGDHHLGWLNSCKSWNILLTNRWAGFLFTINSWCLIQTEPLQTHLCPNVRWIGDLHIQSAAGAMNPWTSPSRFVYLRIIFSFKGVHAQTSNWKSSRHMSIYVLNLCHSSPWYVALCHQWTNSNTQIHETGSQKHFMNILMELQNFICESRQSRPQNISTHDMIQVFFKTWLNGEPTESQRLLRIWEIPGRVPLMKHWSVPRRWCRAITWAPF